MLLSVQHDAHLGVCHADMPEADGPRLTHRCCHGIKTLLALAPPAPPLMLNSKHGAAVCAPAAPLSPAHSAASGADAAAGTGEEAGALALLPLLRCLNAAIEKNA